MHSLFGLIRFKFLQTQGSHMTANCLQDSRREGKKHVNLLQTGMYKVRGHNHFFFFLFFLGFTIHTTGPKLLNCVPDVQLGSRVITKKFKPE